MRVAQSQWTRTGGWKLPEVGVERPDLVLVFAGRSALDDSTALDELREMVPGALLVGCSTAGEIQDVHVLDDSLAATAVAFDSTGVQAERIQLSGPDASRATGERLASKFDPEGLRHLFVLCDGIAVNGSELVRGLKARLPESVSVTGGLSADGSRFERTSVICGDSTSSSSVAAVGFYGERLAIGYGSLGGWDPFGPERLVTRAEGNVLYELDGRSALDLYKLYLGEHAQDLPASALLFPLSIRTEGNEASLVRTVLGVDEDDQSMTFAGDVPTGSYARFMKANFDRLIDGAIGAASASRLDGPDVAAELGLLISCVGRKLLLRQRVEEEVEGVRDVLGETAALTGFYSYGEISPTVTTGRCELHNQTMTITTLAEA